MTETKDLAIKQGEARAVVGRSIFLDIQRFEFAQRIAQMLCTSSMVPTHFRGKDNLGNVLIALNFAERHGADPFMVMQNIYIVHGRPGIEGKLVIALVNKSGRFTPLKFKFDNPLDPTWCECYATEIKTDERLSQTVTWEMVEAEGWNKDKKTRDGSGTIKSKWNTLKSLMFQYRSATFFARVYCPEVLMGMMTREELDDIVELHRVANGTYAAPPSDELPKAEDAKPGTAQELYSPKNGQEGAKGEPGQDEPENEGDDTTAHEKYALDEEFGKLTKYPRDVFDRLRTTGLETFLETYKTAYHTWPETIRMIVDNKCLNKPEWEDLRQRILFTFDKENNGDEGEQEGPKKPDNLGYVNCPPDSRTPYAGKRIHAMVTCSSCKKKVGCDSYAEYLDLQRGGEKEQF